MSFLLFLFNSCSSRVLVEHSGCYDQFHWGKIDENPRTDYEQNIFGIIAPGDKKILSLDSFLQKNDIMCNEILKLSVSVRRDWKDTLLSLVPFMHSAHIVFHISEGSHLPLNK